MRIGVIGGLALMTALVVTTGMAGSLESQDTASNRQVTKADIDRWKKEYSNWGRWGKEDQLGALNLITPAKRKAAAALVKDGVTVSLARDAETEKAADNPNPYVRTMTGIGSDRLAIQFHGYAHTHVDSLAHAADDGKLYNGYTPEEAVVMKEGGHSRNSVYNLKAGIFTRGILIDIPRLKGVPYLEPDARIYPQDLEAWEKQTGLRVSAGDALFVRTGRWTRRAAGSGNSDHIFSGNSDHIPSQKSGRVEPTPVGPTLAVSSSGGRNDRHAQAARNSDSQKGGTRPNRSGHARGRLARKRTTRRA